MAAPEPTAGWGGGPAAGAPSAGAWSGPPPGVGPPQGIGFPVGPPAPPSPVGKSGSKRGLIVGLIAAAALGLIVVVGLLVAGGDGGSKGEDRDVPEEVVAFGLPSSLGGLDLVEDDTVSDQVEIIVGSLPADQRAKVERSLEVGLYSDSTDNALAFIYGGTPSERAELLNGFNDKLSVEVGSTLELGAVDVEEFSVDGTDVLCLEGNQLTWCKAEDGGILVLVAAQALSKETIADLAAEAVEMAPDA